MGKVATAKQTGGGGFEFEDKVTAYFLAYLLSGKFPLQSELGLIERIDFQVRSLGWLFDDLLLTMYDGKNHHKLAVSAKSNRHITGSGFPAEIVTDIWTQYLNTDQEVFDPTLDFMMFVVSPLARSVSENFSTLISTARVTSPDDMLKRLNTRNFSVAQKKLFNNLECPTSLKTANNITDEETCKLLTRIIIKEFDFQSNASNDTVNLISLLQDSLHSKAATEASFLFNRLSALRKEFAPFGGYIDENILLPKITGQFKLSFLSEHTTDWQKIGSFIKTKLENIPDLLGQSYAVNRNEELISLATMLTDKQVVFLLGPSGAGKTVLAKKIAEKVVADHSNVIWLDTNILMSVSLEQHFTIEHSLKDLISKSRTTANLLVIDGADRLYKKEAIDIISNLIRSIIDLPICSWNILMTTQQDDYEELVKKLSRSNLTIPNYGIFTMEAIGREEILKVAERFPQLAELIKHEHLIKLLSNLKFLDLAIFNISKENSTQFSKDIGESHLIDWLWQQEILDKGDNGAANSRFLQSLAEKQANDLRLFTPVTEFQISESIHITELRQNKIIEELDDQLYFTHDLYGDWARYRMIRANRDKVFDYLPKLDLFSPLWCKAIRLFGIYLLEKKKDATEWLTTYKGFDTAEPKSKMIQNLLLESIIFSSDTEKYLKDLWEEFKRDEAKILNHFFEQFFFKATLPNPAILQLLGKFQGITISQLATFHRTPKFIYWIPVMRFLSGHIDELVELSKKNAIRISKDWLEHTPPGSIFRNTAAEIAVILAKWFIHFKGNGGFAMSHSGKDFYQPMLLAFREKQQDINELSLQLCAISLPENPIKKDFDDHHFLLSYNPRRGTKLPHGPFFKVDDDFQEACLDKENLIPMMEVNPQLTKDILLALLINEPENVENPGSHNFKYNIYEPHQWFPPFYHRGPFLNFFKTASKEAVSFVITLTNFATDEWKLEQQASQEETSFIKLDIPGIGEREFYGDSHVYYWFRDIGNAPHSLVSILMALEKFLLDLIDEDKQPESYITQLLEISHSLSVVGLLSSIGRYYPKLFLGVLKPFLAQYDLYKIESQLDYGAMGIEGHQMMGSNLLDSTTRELASKWHSMPHRKTSIKSVALRLTLGNKDINDLFKSIIIPEWIKLNQQYNDEGYIDPFLVNTIGHLNRENYVAYEDEHNVGLVYKEPEEVTQQLEPVRSVSAIDSDDFTFAFVRQQELENNRKYEIKELEQIWEKIQNFSEQTEDNLFNHLNKRLSNIFAGIAILVLNENIIRKLHPEYFEWIDKVAGEVFSQVTFVPQESTMLIGLGSWQGFAAKFVPKLFVKEPENKIYRHWLAILALNFNNEAVGYLFKEISRFLKFNDPTFVQLQNLYIQRCRLISQHKPLRWDEETDWTKVFEEILADYIENKTPCNLIDICGSMATTIQRENRRRRKHGQPVTPLKDPGIDANFLFPALQFPEFESMLEQREKEYVLGWYQKLVDLTVWTWGEANEASPNLDISLSPFDEWLILNLSLLLPKLEKDQASNFWKPLLAYGIINSVWLSYFFDNLIVRNYQEPDRYETLGLIWNDMIDYATTESTWKFKREFYREHHKIWEGLLGVSNLQMKVWELGYENLLAKVSKKVIIYLAKQWVNSDAINTVATLLKTPSAPNFIDSGTLILDMHLKWQNELDTTETPSGLVRVPFKYYDSVASACSYLWSNYKSYMTAKDSVFQAFRNIIIHLVAIQNPIGLELQDRLVEQ